MADNNQIPESLRGYFEEKETQPIEVPKSQVPESLQGYMAGSAPGQTLAYAIGKTPQLAIPISPLSPLERAAFGYARYPKDQMNYLEKRFGHGNVQQIKMDDNAANYVVKTEDGHWKQVDPHGISDIPMDVVNGEFGQAVNRIKNFNLRNTIGGAMQFAGDKGAVSAGAALGAGSAITAAAPVITAASAASGPFAPLTAVAGTIGAGIAGGMGGGALGSVMDAGVRQASQYVQDTTGDPILGAHQYDTDDLGQQVLGDMIFGGMQEAAGPFLSASTRGVTRGAAKMFGKTLEKLGDSAQSKSALASMIKVSSGMKDGLARAWAESPSKVSDYIPEAVSDATNHSFSLLERQKGKVQDFFEGAMSAKKKIGKEYDAIEKAVEGKRFDASKQLMPSPEESGGTKTIGDIVSDLKEKQYIDSGLKAIPNSAEDFSRDTTGQNGKLLETIAGAYRGMAKRQGQVYYHQLRQFKSDLANFIDGEGRASDGYLRNTAKELQGAVKNSLSEGLHEVSPQLSSQYAKLNAKYADLMDGTLLEDLASKASDRRLDAFLKQLHRNDGTYNFKMMDTVSNILGIENPTKDILHMQAAIESVPMFTGSGSVKLGPINLPASPFATRQMMKVAGPVTEGVGAVQDAGKAATIAAIKKVSSVYRSLPSSERLNIIKSPEAIAGLSDMVAGSVVSEEQDKNKLLQNAGAFQNSQFQGGQ